jgi:hypothetical protein
LARPSWGLSAQPTPQPPSPGCFSVNQTTPLWAGTPVHLTYWNGFNWQHLNVKYSADRFGCVYANTAPWSHLYLRLYVDTGGTNGSFTMGASYYGYSRFYSVSGPGHANLDRVVLQYRCTSVVPAACY